MSSGAHHGHHGHVPAEPSHGQEDPHGSLSGYLIGFGLSVVLTAIPFWLVMGHVLPTATATVLTIMGFAAVQVVVHVVYFLHLDPKVEAGWNLMALIFTLVIVGIALVGSLWVMFHLNANMMPMSMPELRNTP
jgi:cytochrome o ubiquinol oxidase subunit IV